MLQLERGRDQSKMGRASSNVVALIPRLFAGRGLRCAQVQRGESLSRPSSLMLSALALDSC